MTALDQFIPRDADLDRLAHVIPKTDEPKIVGIQGLIVLATKCPWHAKRSGRSDWLRKPWLGSKMADVQPLELIAKINRREQLTGFIDVEGTATRLHIPTYLQEISQILAWVDFGEQFTLDRSKLGQQIETNVGCSSSQHILDADVRPRPFVTRPDTRGCDRRDQRTVKFELKIACVVTCVDDATRLSRHQYVSVFVDEKTAARLCTPAALLCCVY